MKNFKLLRCAFFIIFCVFLLFIFSCAPEAGVEKKVETLLKANDYTSALELLDEGIKQNPEKPNLRALKVKVLAKLGKFIEATEEYLRFYSFTEKHDSELLYELAFSVYNREYYTKLDLAFILDEVDDKEGGIDIFKEIFKSGDKQEKFLAAVGLAWFDDESGIEILKEAFNTKDKWTRLHAAVPLAKLGDKSVIDFLKKNLEDGNLLAAEGLAYLGDKSGIDFLKKNLKDGNLPAAVALARLNDKSSISFLKKALEDEWEGWSEAAKVLARLGDKSIIPVLTRKFEERGIELYRSGELRDYASLILSLYKLTK